jgi:uncharacterized protein YrzB (UPF0473 family)
MKYKLNDKILIEKDGQEVECNVVFTFDCKQTKKSYVGYSDNTIAPNGRKTIYVSSYNPLNEEIVLEDINDQKELNMIQDVLMKIDGEAAGN